METLLNFPHFHLVSLGITLIILINAIYTKRLILNVLSLMLIATIAYLQLSTVNETNILHFSFDLVILGLLAYPAKMISGSLLRIVYLVFSLFLLSTTHNYIAHSISESSSANKYDQNAELLVQFSDKKALKDWISLHDGAYNINYPAFEPKDESYLLDEYLTIDLVNDADVESVKNLLLKIPGIIHVEFNEVVELKLPEISNIVPFKNNSKINDPLVSNQWAANKFELEKFHKLISSQAASLADRRSLIAILDTGIDAKHEDLIDNYISTKSSYDTDPKDHGTHCAGIAAAVTGNNIGIASWIPPDINVKLTSIKVLNTFGMGTQQTIVKGIIEAADIGASVISISIGGVTSEAREKAYGEAVAYANSKGSIVVVAAGNSNIDAQGISPANTKGVITITAVDQSMKKAFFGNTVDNIEMGLAAPGDAIYSTIPKNKYKSNSGTSMSAPFVSGVIGLLKLYDPELTTKEAFNLLKQDAIQRDGLFIVDPLSTFQSFFTSRSI